MRAIIDARQAARSSQRIDHLKQIGPGPLNDGARHGSFPPAYASDALGKPL